MGFGSYGGSLIAAGVVMNNTHRNHSGYNGSIDNCDNELKPRKWYAKWLIITTLLIGLAYCGIFIHGQNRNTNVSGTVIAKGTSWVRHGKHNSEQVFIFAVKPDNPNFKIFDVNVTFGTYSTHNVGDKVKFNDIMKNQIGDETWTWLDELVMATSFIIGIGSVIAWLVFFHYDSIL